MVADRPRLPEPTGPFRVGTTTRHWVDPDRREIFDGPSSGPRELMVQLWYPASANADGRWARYTDFPWTLESLALLMDLPRHAFAGIGALETHAIEDAPIATTGGPFPVLLFSHGRCGVREHNTFQVEELASHGYVIATIDHPYAASGVTFPDGRMVEFDPRLLPPWPRHDPEDPDGEFLDSIIPFLADDLAFALRRIEAIQGDPVEGFAGRLDLDRVGAFGVSLGGVVVAELVAREAAFAAGLILDGYVPAAALATGLARPFMWISRDAATMRREGWSEADVGLAQGSMRAGFDALPGDGYIVLVPGMYHVDFSDGPLLSPLIAARGLSGPFDGERGRDILRRYSVAFFDRHLKGLPAPLLDERPEAEAGLTFESRAQAPISI